MAGVSPFGSSARSTSSGAYAPPNAPGALRAPYQPIRSKYDPKTGGVSIPQQTKTVAKTTGAARGVASGAGGGGAAASSSAPPEITQIDLAGQADPRSEKLASGYEDYLGELAAGRTREADVFRSGMASDIEQQIAQARENALASGQPWTGDDEARMRAELKRGQYGAEAEFALGTQKERGAAMREGLDVVQAPWSTEMAEKGLSQGTQKLLMDYAVQRGGLLSEDRKTAAMEAGQAIDAYTAFLQMLGGSFNMSSSYG